MSMHAQSFLNELLRLLKLVCIKELFGLYLEARDVCKYAHFYFSCRASLRCTQVVGPRLRESLNLLVSLLGGYITDTSRARASIACTLRKAKSFVSGASAGLAKRSSLGGLLQLGHDLLLLASDRLLVVRSTNSASVLGALHGHVVSVGRLNALHETLHRSIRGHTGGHHRIWSI